MYSCSGWKIACLPTSSARVTPSFAHRSLVPLLTFDILLSLQKLLASVLYESIVFSRIDIEFSQLSIVCVYA